MDNEYVESKTLYKILKTMNLNCFKCGKETEVYESELEKSPSKIVFCSIGCFVEGKIEESLKKHIEDYHRD